MTYTRALSTNLSSGVLQRDEATVGSALADADGTLGAALVRRLGAHLALDHLTHFERRIYSGARSATRVGLRLGFVFVGGFVVRARASEVQCRIF